MKVTDRYATAVRSSCLTVDPRTTFSDTDVLGAMGLAARELKKEDKHSLAVALERLFLGDNSASVEIVDALATKLRNKAAEDHLKMTAGQCRDVARACLAWHRHGTCRPCGGHGKLPIEGTPHLGEESCPVCMGRGQYPFEIQFREEWRGLAVWLVEFMKREQGRAGPAAMRKLAPKLDLE
ncbi:MAG: hypothetical protein EOO27_32025 [Comamonadaceae bacterium]|nr:MAG: hypothetical protein EOO27_32025 [Comamonadaceae bacterium]